MDAARWRRIEEIFHDVADAPPSERPALLAERCGDDAALRAEVEGLLEADAAEANVPELIAAEARRVAPPAIDVGRRIGRYEIVSAIGAGGMGEVFRARDTQLGRDVAIKVLRHEQVGRSEASLLREAQAMAKLSHPNVVVVYEVGTVDGEVFLAMEFVEGLTLRAWLREAPRSVDEIGRVFLGAARGLAAAHEVGIVHRDFKPDNVLVGADGRARVADFGLAGDAGGVSEADDATSLRADVTRFSSAAAGTPAYMAPEQYLHEPVDARTDQFAFAVALHEALHGRRPFEGETVGELRRNVLAGRAAPPSRAPRAVRAVIGRALSRKRGDRYPSMDALSAALARAIERPRKLRRLAAIGGALAVAAIGVGVLALRRPREWRPVIVERGPAFDENGTPVAFSPDGRSIAYDSDRDGDFRVYLGSAAGTDERPITPRGMDCEEPRFARDGKSIYVRTKQDIGRVDVRGGTPVTVAENAAWIDDCGGGRLVIAYRSRPGCLDLCPALVVREPDGHERELARYVLSDRPDEIRCDPSGRGVVYTEAAGLHRPARIMMRDLDGGEPVALSDRAVGNATPYFHPDGRSVLYSSMRGGASNLWEQPLAGGPPVQLTFGAGPDLGPIVSPDGKTIVFDVDTSWAPLSAMSLDRPDSAERLTTTFDDVRMIQPDPTGRELLLGIVREGKELVARWSIADREERVAFEGEAPAWSFDGTEILWTTVAPPRLMAMPRDGGPRRVIAELPYRVRAAGVLGTDDVYFFGAFAPLHVSLATGAVETIHGVLRLPLTTGFTLVAADPFSPLRVFAPGETPSDTGGIVVPGIFFDIVRDESAVVVKRDDQLVRHDLATGAETVLASIRQLETAHLSADDKTLYYAAWVGRVRRFTITNYGDRARPAAP